MISGDPTNIQIRRRNQISEVFLFLKLKDFAPCIIPSSRISRIAKRWFWWRTHCHQQTQSPINKVNQRTQGRDQLFGKSQWPCRSNRTWKWTDQVLGLEIVELKERVARAQETSQRLFYWCQRDYVLFCCKQWVDFVEHTKILKGLPL